MTCCEHMKTETGLWFCFTIHGSQTVAQSRLQSKVYGFLNIFLLFHNNWLDGRDLLLGCSKFDTYRTVFKWRNLEEVSKEIQLSVSSGRWKIWAKIEMIKWTSCCLIVCSETTQLGLWINHTRLSWSTTISPLCLSAGYPFKALTAARHNLPYDLKQKIRLAIS